MPARMAPVLLPRLLAVSALLAHLSEALVVAHSRPVNFSFLSIEQVPGPTPAYIKYGPPEFTTFSNSTTACMACIEFFPEKQDGKRFNSRMYEDKDGGVWAKACRAGLCNFRDPQTQPVGGVIGKGVGPNGTEDGRTCITRDPVPWYADCEPIAKTASKSLTDITQYCSYREQLFIPPPDGEVSFLKHSKDKAWSRIGESKEQCLTTIAKQGAALFDTMSFCDSDLQALSGCCETVFSSLNCVAETAIETNLWHPSNGSIFLHMHSESSDMLTNFAKFCVPLCQAPGKEEFCKNSPHADICQDFETCSDCTAAGGLWCPKLESCHCPGPTPPCIAPPVLTPLQCLPKDNELKRFRKPTHSRRKATIKKDDEEKNLEDAEKALCPYAKFAQEWQVADPTHA